jgi:acyl-CoA thioesterase
MTMDAEDTAPSDPERADVAAGGLLRPSDAGLVPLVVDDSGRGGRFTVHRTIARPDGILYGGSGATAAVVAMEAATRRPARWATIQFVASPTVGDVVETDVDVVAAGHRISQVQVRATVQGRLMFSAVGATATARPDGLQGQYVPMPDVAPPGEGRDLFTGFDLSGNAGHHERFVMRLVSAAEAGAPGHVPLWTRFTEPLAFTPATIAFLADMVPMSIARAAGQMGAGSSIDNTLRFGPRPEPDAEWLLLDLHGQLATDGYGHGSLEVWSPAGRLVATGSQTATMNHLFGPLPGDAATML